MSLLRNDGISVPLPSRMLTVNCGSVRLLCQAELVKLGIAFIVSLALLPSPLVRDTSRRIAGSLGSCLASPG